MGRSLRLLFPAILMIMSLHNMHADTTRGIGTLDNTGQPQDRIGRQYIVVIAIDDYEHWMPLRSPVRDAREIRRILVSRYHVDEVCELYDGRATKAAIIRLFVDLQKRVKSEDSLLVFYAGHGHLDKSSNTGFWIPVNAGTDVYEQQNWLPHTQLKGLIANIPAAHVLVISDSCFAGDLMYATRSLPPAFDSNYLRNAYSLVSRQVLTSGAVEAVPDESTFAEQLKAVLRRNERPILDALMLYDEVRLGVDDTIPLLGTLAGTGHQEGASFLLFLNEEAAVSDAASRPKELPLVPDDVPEGGPPAAPRESVRFSGGIGIGWMIPVGPVRELLLGGPAPVGRLHFLFRQDWGELAVGLLGGALFLAGAEDPFYPYDLVPCPVALSLGFSSLFHPRVFFAAELAVGAALSIATPRISDVTGVTTTRVFVSPAVGAGLRLGDGWVVTLQGRFVTVFFDDSKLTGISPELIVEYTF